MEVLKSDKLNLVDFLFFSGRRDNLALACRVQLVSKGKLPVTVDRGGMTAAARKRRGLLGALSGRRPLMSFIACENGGKPVPDGLNFYERAVFEGAGEGWFPDHQQAMAATYNRMGLMKEGNVGYRGEELRGMYQAGMDRLMSALKMSSAGERARLLNEHAAWYFAFFALPLPKLEPKEMKAHIRQRNADRRDPIIDDADILAALGDAALHALAAAEAVSG